MRKNTLLLIGTLFIGSFQIQAQCSYNLLNFTHIDCYGDNTGEIEVSITNSNSTFWWNLPNGTTSSSTILTSLQEGSYVLTIMENLIPGDTSSAIICKLVDTLKIEQTIQITAVFTLKNMCSENDSADVMTYIYGGTPPYSTLWVQTGDTARNTTNIAPSLTPYTFNIIDENGCQRNQWITINTVQSMESYMSAEGVICKDDNSGNVRVFIENGTSPYTFRWGNDIVEIDEDASQINNLSPGTYSVEITDTMGCTISDSIEIQSNPEICITIYKVFSPNEDGIHDFWEIENIHLYPEALVEVYDRLGKRIYRRRNYINSKDVAFGGKVDGRRIPSGVYYYILDLENEDTVFKGTLTIVR